MLAKLEEDIKRIGRHTAILRLVITHQSIGIIKISKISGFRQHQVRYSLRVLENQGLIRPSPHGAVVTAKGKKFVKNLERRIERLRKALEKLTIFFC